jgi:hypothetical protein
MNKNAHFPSFSKRSGGNKIPAASDGVSNKAVMPVKTGIQKSILDSLFRGNDKFSKQASGNRTRSDEREFNMEKKRPTEETQKEKLTPKERIAAIEEIKLRGLFLGGYAITADAAPIVFDTAEYQQLVDQFYEENKDVVTPVMLRACRENYEFFMTIVEKALNQFIEQDTTAS